MGCEGTEHYTGAELGCAAGSETRSPAAKDAAPGACQLIMTRAAQQSGAIDECTGEALGRYESSRS
jgi:hypothetical protein